MPSQNLGSHNAWNTGFAYNKRDVEEGLRKLKAQMRAIAVQLRTMDIEQWTMAIRCSIAVMLGRASAGGFIIRNYDRYGFGSNFRHLKKCLTQIKTTWSVTRIILKIYRGYLAA